MFGDNGITNPPNKAYGWTLQGSSPIHAILDITCIIIGLIRKKTVVAAIISFGSVVGAPFELSERVFDIRAKLTLFHHVSAVDGDGASAPRLRFIHLVPKYDYEGAFTDGFGCAALGHGLKVHKFLFVDINERFVQLVGLSDCKNWFAAVLGIYCHHHSEIQYKTYGGLKGQKVRVFGSLDELVDFVDLHLHVVHSQVKLFYQLIKKGLTSHIFTFKLRAKLAPALELHSS